MLTASRTSTSWPDVSPTSPRPSPPSSNATPSPAPTVEELAYSPAVLAQPEPAAWLTTSRHTWTEDREQARQAAAERAAIANAAHERQHGHEHDRPYYQPDHGRGGPQPRPLTRATAKAGRKFRAPATSRCGEGSSGAIRARSYGGQLVARVMCSESNSAVMVKVATESLDVVAQGGQLHRVERAVLNL